MQDIEPTNLCETCKKQPECFEKGIFARESCTEYEPLPLDQLLERDEFVRGIMVGSCPKCGSEDTYDCENNPLLEDNTVGHCLDCETYWCLECGYVFETVGKGMQCPHWGICAECSDKNGYLDEVEFIEKVCPTCEHYSEGCQLEDPSECEKASQFRCPYDGIVSECPKIQEFLEDQPS